MKSSPTDRPSRFTQPIDPASALASSCAGKHGYLSFEEADRVITARQRTAKKRRLGKKQNRANRAVLRPYRCRFCHHWHITGAKS